MENDRILNVGPLRTPHYELTLEHGAAMMSTRENDCWVVRLVYDPVNYAHMEALRQVQEHPEKFTGEGDLPYELGADAFYQDPDVQPPLVVAFGDPGESREEVERAFLEAICSAWCQMLARMLGRQNGPWNAGEGHFDELDYPDVWHGTVDAIDYDLLCMVRSASSFEGLGLCLVERPVDDPGVHRETYVSLEEQLTFWNKHAVGRVTVLTMPSEQAYFKSRIPEWRRACKSAASRVHGRLDPPSGIF